jgi:hypothetical protein
MSSQQYVFKCANYDSNIMSVLISQTGSKNGCSRTTKHRMFHEIRKAKDAAKRAESRMRKKNL